MDRAFEILWWAWCPASALLVRSLALRMLRVSGGRSAILAGCGAWLACLCAAMIFVSWSGMELYGFNGDDPWQWAGWFVLFLSPFGLPLLFGAPLVMAVQGIRLCWKSAGMAQGQIGKTGPE